jgi:hypothetical protein
VAARSKRPKADSGGGPVGQGVAVSPRGGLGRGTCWTGGGCESAWRTRAGDLLDRGWL